MLLIIAESDQLLNISRLCILSQLARKSLKKSAPKVKLWIFLHDKSELGHSWTLRLIIFVFSFLLPANQLLAPDIN